jgi:hypothetical protein
MHPQDKIMSFKLKLRTKILKTCIEINLRRATNPQLTLQNMSKVIYMKSPKYFKYMEKLLQSQTKM